MWLIDNMSCVTHWYMTCWFDIFVWCWPCVGWCVLDGVPASWLLRQVSHASFICVTWLVCLYHMPHSYVSHDSFVCITCLIHMCHMTCSSVLHASFICVTWLVEIRATWRIGSGPARQRQVVFVVCQGGGCFFYSRGNGNDGSTESRVAGLECQGPCLL